MARVGFAITDPKGGGAWYRGMFPAACLRALGHEVVCGEMLRFGPSWELGIDLREGVIDNPQGIAGELYTDEAGTEGEVWCPDVMVLTAGWSMGILEVLELGRQAGAGEAGRNRSQTIALDFDDGLEAPRDNAGWRPRQAELKAAAALSADRLVCATPMIARDFALVRRPTKVVRNRVSPELFETVRDTNEARLALDCYGTEWGAAAPAESSWGLVGEPVTDDRLTLGYRGPMPWHRADIEALKPIAGRLVELGCYLVHIGAREDDAQSFAEAVGIPFAERRLQVPFALYPNQLAGIDVGLVPFARRRWSTYKSAIGALEWNAAGVPWLASDVPEYRRLHSASSLSSWPRWVRELERLRDGEERRDLYRRQVQRSERFYATEGSARARDVGREWADALALELSPIERIAEHTGRPELN